LKYLTILGSKLRTSILAGLMTSCGVLWS
jgi:hypothetical protein